MKLTTEQIKRMIKEELEGLDEPDTIVDMAEQVLSASYTGDREAVRRAAENNSKVMFDARMELGRSRTPKKVAVDHFADALYSFLEQDGSLEMLQQTAQGVIDEYMPVDEMPDYPDLDMDF